MSEQNVLDDRKVVLRSPQFLPVQFYLAMKDNTWGAGTLASWEAQNDGQFGACARLSCRLASGRMQYQSKDTADLIDVKIQIEINTTTLTHTGSESKDPTFVILMVEGGRPPLTLIQTALLQDLLVKAFDQQKSLFAAAFGLST